MMQVFKTSSGNLVRRIDGYVLHWWPVAHDGHGWYVVNPHPCVTLEKATSRCIEMQKAYPMATVVVLSAYTKYGAVAQADELFGKVPP